MGPFGGLVHARLAASGPRHPLLGGRAALATVVGEREGMAGEARVVGARQSELDYYHEAQAVCLWPALRCPANVDGRSMLTPC